MTYEPEPLGPITVQEAEDYLQERNHLEHQIATLAGQAKKMISPLASRLREINEKNERRVEDYVREQYAVNPDKKTFNFWNGTAKLTKCGGNPVLKDEREALEFARRHDLTWLIEPPSIRKGDFQKYAADQIKKTGELIPGVDIEPVRQSFSLKAGGPKKESLDAEEDQ